MMRDPPLSLQMRDWTGLERRMSASTESPWTRGESPMNDTVSGGTGATEIGLERIEKRCIDTEN